MTTPALAQDFLDVPVIVTSTPGVFSQLVSRGRFEALHSVMLGDSQETCPTGAGQAYVPAFNSVWAEHYGSTGRTPLVQPGINFGGGSSTGEWLTRGAIIQPAISTHYDDPATLPGIGNWSLPAPAPHRFGWFLLLQPRATSVISSLEIDRSRTWFDVSQGVYLDVYGLRDPAYGEIGVTWSMSDATTPDIFAEPIDRGVTDFANAGGSSPVARTRFGPIVWSGSRYRSIQAEFYGADQTRPARMVSASFVSVARPVGLAVTDIAQGGYNAASLAANHPGALAHLSGLDADFAFIAFGANDAGAGDHLAFKQRMRELIATIRANTSPTLPIVLLADPYRGLLQDVSVASFELFPRMAAELATEFEGVCAVNSRRLTHESGWTAEAADAYLTDGIHYRTNAAMLKARLEVDALWKTFICLADIGSQGGVIGGDGRLNNDDFIAFIESFFSQTPIADVGQHGGNPGSDGSFDNSDFIAFIDAYFAGCP